METHHLLTENYYNYLIGFIGGDRGYGKLLRTLFEREFYSPINMDQNRAAYGLLLRKRFAGELYDEDILYMDLGPCRVLEMLIALAERIDTIGSIGMPVEDRIPHFFWIMLSNLDMATCTDMVWDYEKERLVNHKIDILLDRKYEYNGSGGLFPLQFPKTDQRNVEIWYQMQSYFLEKF